MVTNGVALSPTRGQALKDAGLDALIVSLHGPEETHDLVTGVPGSFQRTLRNLRAFCEGPRRTRVLINVVLTRETALALDDLAALGRSVGADHVRFEHLLFLTPAEQATHDAEAPQAPGRDLSVQTWLCEPEVPGTLPPDLVQRLRAVEEHHGSFVSVKPALGPAEVAAWYTDGYRSRRRCFFLWRSLFLDPEGNVLPCQHYARMRFGNVLREPIGEIWNSPRYRWMRRRIRDGLLPGCSRCVKL
jgi:MoaA/NifB/PqqE/SkfB family radical SAM enzyme